MPNPQSTEDRIPLRPFRSAADLKREITQRIQERARANWEFVSLKSQGSFLCLVFRSRHAQS